MLAGTWKSKDDKYSLFISEAIAGDYPMVIDMPIGGKIEGVLKNGEVANLQFTVNEKAVFLYLFVQHLDEGTISIKGSGRSAGRFQGDIPITNLYRM